MARRVRRVVVKSTVGLAVVASVLFGAFAAWRIPNEREEDRLFKAQVQRDDGPHVTWIDDRTVRISTFHFDAARQEYTRQDVTSGCDAAGPAVAAIDPNAWIDCDAQPAQPVAETAAPVIAAVSDIHGHYHHLAALLQKSGVVDAKLDWSFGINHLVVAGDILDKGPEITKALWFVRKLERQAASAGGRVHYLLGNHEYLALAGASRINERKYIELTTSLGITYADLFSTASELGRWIRRHGVVVRINDTLFVHGGVSPMVANSGVTLDGLNRIALDTLDGRQTGGDGANSQAGLVWGRDSVTTYRGYFDRSFPVGFWRTLRGDLREHRDADAQVRVALERYGARRIVVGHTEARQITALLGGRLIAICYRFPATDFVADTSRAELLLIEGAQVWRVGLDGTRNPL